MLRTDYSILIYHDLNSRQRKSAQINKLNLTLNLLTWRIWWAPNNACRWQMGFNSAFKGLMFPCGPCDVVDIATGYGLGRSGDRSPVEARFPRLSRPALQPHPASCTIGTGSFPGVKSGQGVTLTPHPLLVSWSRKIRAVPLLPLWAVRTVKRLSACTRVHFTFFTCLLHYLLHNSESLRDRRTCTHNTIHINTG